MTAILAFLGGCGRSGVDLTTDDPEYPVTNPSPRHPVSLTLNAPDDLTVAVTADYSATSRDPDCQTNIGLGVWTKIAVSVPVQLHAGERPGQRVGEVYTDRLAAGHCNWQFSDISATVSKGARTSPSNAFVYSRPFMVSQTPFLVAGYDADHRPGPIWRCAPLDPRPNAPAESRELLDCEGGRVESGRILIGADVSKVQFSIIDDDVRH